MEHLASGRAARRRNLRANVVRTSARPRASTRGSLLATRSLRLARFSCPQRPARAPASLAGTSMVRRGSTVRVRQRALQKPRKPASFLSDPLALSPTCVGYGALYGAFREKSPVARQLRQQKRRAVTPEVANGAEPCGVPKLGSCLQIRMFRARGQNCGTPYAGLNAVLRSLFAGPGAFERSGVFAQVSVLLEAGHRTCPLLSLRRPPRTVSIRR